MSIRIFIHNNFELSYTIIYTTLKIVPCDNDFLLGEQDHPAKALKSAKIPSVNCVLTVTVYNSNILRVVAKQPLPSLTFVIECNICEISFVASMVGEK